MKRLLVVALAIWLGLAGVVSLGVTRSFRVAPSIEGTLVLGALAVLTLLVVPILVARIRRTDLEPHEGVVPLASVLVSIMLTGFILSGYPHPLFPTRQEITFRNGTQTIMIGGAVYSYHLELIDPFSREPHASLVLTTTTTQVSVPIPLFADGPAGGFAEPANPEDWCTLRAGTGPDRLVLRTRAALREAEFGIDLDTRTAIELSEGRPGEREVPDQD
jgi:hypothetical protein